MRRIMMHGLVIGISPMAFPLGCLSGGSVIATFTDEGAAQ